MIKPFLIAIACLLGIDCGNTSAQEKPLKVFILVGQSNMQGHAHVRTLPHLGMDPATRSILDEIQNEQGKPRVIENVWISYLSSGGVKAGPLTTGFGADENKIGPELTFGIYMQKKLNEPILIIKAAWGGKSLQKGKLEQVLLERMRTAEFTVREYQILQLGKSNAEFHYLGCSKIMAQIGKAFAEAMPIAIVK